MSDSIKLLAGKLFASWREYPEARRSLLQMPTGQPILVTGAHRSGTTWFGNMLARPGVWHIHEPFAPYKGLWDEWFTFADADNARPDIDRIMARLLSGKEKRAMNMKWTEHRLMPIRLLPQTINRVLIKDPIACLMSEYLTRHFSLKTYVLFRHPAAFVESVLRLKWPQAGAIKHFLSCEELMDRWLFPYAELMELVQHNEGAETAAVLHGCLNKVLWGYVQRNEDMMPCLYEEVCQDPVNYFSRLYTELSLPYDETVQRMHIDMCFSENVTQTQYRAHEVRRVSADMAEAWRSRLGKADVSEIRKIWEKFEIPLYQDAAAW